MNKRLFLVACVALLGILEALAGEANYQPFLVGERALGMGGAVNATADGVDALYYNPAGLANTPQSRISLSASLYGLQKYKTEDKVYPGEDLEVRSVATVPAAVGGVSRVNDRWSAGFGVFVPSMGTAREIQAFEDLQHYYNWSYDEQILKLGPGVGWKVNDKVSVGAAAFGVYESASRFANMYWGHVRQLSSHNYKYDVASLVAGLGIQVRPAGPWRLGATIESPSVRLWGDGSVMSSAIRGTRRGVATQTTYIENLDADHGLPTRVTAGLGWQKPKEVAIGMDVTHHFARDYDWLKGTTSDGEDVTVEREREAVTDFQVGAEYYIRGKYPVRAGFFTSLSAAPETDPQRNAYPPHVNLYGVSASGGLEDDRVVFNVGVNYVWGSGEDYGNRPSTTGEPETAVVDVEVENLFVFVSTAYLF